MTRLETALVSQVFLILLIELCLRQWVVLLRREASLTWHLIILVIEGAHDLCVPCTNTRHFLIFFLVALNLKICI